MTTTRRLAALVASLVFLGSPHAWAETASPSPAPSTPAPAATSPAVVPVSATPSATPSASTPAATPTSASPQIEANVEATDTGVHIGGRVTLGDQPIANVLVTIAVDGVTKATPVTSADGVFNADVPMPANDTKHTVKITTAATADAPAATFEDTFVAQKPGSTVLNVEADRTTVPGGFSVTLTGTLLDGEKQPLAGETVAVGLNDAKGTDATSVTDDEGAFTIAVPLEVVTEQKSVVATVHYDGDGTIPGASKEITLTVTPMEGLATDDPSGAAAPTLETSPTTQTFSAAPQEETQPAPGPSIATLWPLILTLGVGLAMLAAIGVMALRRRREVEQTELDEDLESISHGDLRSDD